MVAEDAVVVALGIVAAENGGSAGTVLFDKGSKFLHALGAKGFCPIVDEILSGDLIGRP